MLCSAWVAYSKKRYGRVAYSKTRSGRVAYCTKCLVNVDYITTRVGGDTSSDRLGAETAFVIPLGYLLKVWY